MRAQAGRDGRICSPGAPDWTPERELWWLDPEAAVTAELGAAQNVSRGWRSQTHRGVALRDRLPRVAALFPAGLITDLMVSTIVARTHLITDHRGDGRGRHRPGRPRDRWGALSIAKTEQAIDALVDHYDPACALRRTATLA